jgi:hypothetical protein
VVLHLVQQLFGLAQLTAPERGPSIGAESVEFALPPLEPEDVRVHLRPELCLVEALGGFQQRRGRVRTLATSVVHVPELLVQVAHLLNRPLERIQIHGWVWGAARILD